MSDQEDLYEYNPSAAWKNEFSDDDDDEEDDDIFMPTQPQKNGDDDEEDEDDDMYGYEYDPSAPPQGKEGEDGKKHEDLKSIFLDDVAEIDDDEGNAQDVMKKTENQMRKDLKNIEKKEAFLISGKIEDLPWYKKIGNLMLMMISFLTLPLLIAYLIVSSIVSFIMYREFLTFKDIWIGLVNISLACLAALLGSLIWMTWIIFLGPRKYINMLVLPISYLIQIGAVIAFTTFLIMSLTTAYTTIYSMWIPAVYAAVLVFNIPFWLVRYKSQTIMLETLAKRILTFVFRVKFVFFFAIAGCFVELLIMYATFIFNGFWYWNIPMAILACELIRNVLHYTVIRLDIYYMNQHKSHNNNSISEFMTAATLKMLNIAVASVLSIFQPILSAIRNATLAILTMCVLYHYMFVFIIRHIRKDTNPKTKKQKMTIFIVVCLILSLFIIFFFLLSWVLIFLSIVLFILTECILVFTSRSLISLMAVYNTNIFRAFWMKILDFVHSPLILGKHNGKAAEGNVNDDAPHDEDTDDNLIGRFINGFTLRLSKTMKAFSEPNNIMLYLVEIGSISIGCGAGVAVYWFMWYMKVPETETLQRYYPYSQVVIVCFAVAYELSSTLLQLLEARIMLCYLAVKMKGRLLQLYSGGKIEETGMVTQREYYYDEEDEYDDDYAGYMAPDV